MCMKALFSEVLHSHTNVIASDYSLSEESVYHIIKWLYVLLLLRNYTCMKDAQRPRFNIPCLPLCNFPYLF